MSAGGQIVRLKLIECPRCGFDLDEIWVDFEMGEVTAECSNCLYCHGEATKWVVGNESQTSYSQPDRKVGNEGQKD